MDIERDCRIKYRINKRSSKHHLILREMLHNPMTLFRYDKSCHPRHYIFQQISMKINLWEIWGRQVHPGPPCSDAPGSNSYSQVRHWPIIRLPRTAPDLKRRNLAQHKWKNTTFSRSSYRRVFRDPSRGCLSCCRDHHLTSSSNGRWAPTNHCSPPAMAEWGVGETDDIIQHMSGISVCIYIAVEKSPSWILWDLQILSRALYQLSYLSPYIY